MKSFRADRRGNVAVLFGLMAVPLFGLSGMALDYSRASELRSVLQNKADSVALNAAVAGVGGNHGALLSDMEAEIAARYGSANGQLGLTIQGTWVNDEEFRVTARATSDTTLVHVMPGVDRGLDVSIESVARVVQDSTQYEPPVLTELEPEAGDYNEIHAYCFDYEGSGPLHARRTQMTLIADNDGNQYNYEWPRCAQGESLSFRMRNVRHARSYPELWNNPNQWPYRAEYDFYTDTVIDGGKEHISVRREIAWIPDSWRQYHNSRQPSDGFNILEKIRCDTVEQCQVGTNGSIIPSGKNRTPKMMDDGCEPGKYMYFGWEDRPTGQPGPNGSWTDPAWTDGDFDDIRIVVKCPDGGALGDRVVRLVK